MSLTLSELCRLTGASAQFVEALLREGLLEAPGGDFPEECLSRVRVAWTLSEELEVNLAGVQVVLELRDRLLRQRDDVIRLVRMLQEMLNES